MPGFLISHVKLYDGTGAPPQTADVAVSNGVIAGITPGGAVSHSGLKEIDGDGLCLAPGFIDVHGHSDSDILELPSSDSKISQGITTEIAGNCGFSDFLERNDGGFESYAKEVDAAKPAINLACLVGHNTLRTLVMGEAARPAYPHEAEKMRRLAAEALARGAAGLSSGLWYSPGIFADQEEVCSLASALRGTGKVYATHLRSEGDTLIESIREACAIARAGSGLLQISHFKTWGSTNWGKLGGALSVIEEERKTGLRITMDRYPYLYAGTGLRMCLPSPWSAMTPERIHSLLQSEEEREKLAAELKKTGPSGCSWDRILLAGTDVPAHEKYLGKTILQSASAEGLDPAEFCVRLLADELNPFAMSGLLCGENLETILKQDSVMPGSDAGLASFQVKSAHPRKFGTMGRFFRMTADLTSPAEAVRRMTSLAADIFHLKGRGRIAPGYIADLVLFDEHRFQAPEDYADPVRPVPGIEAVWVSGELSWTSGGGSAGRSGRFLRIPNRKE